MMQSVLRTLSEKDTVLLLETRRKRLDPLAEDAVVELHRRVLRARNRHPKNYRRAGSSRVPTTLTRAGAAQTNQKTGPGGNTDRGVFAAERLDDRRPFTPIKLKRAASSGSAGARRQARKDNR